MARPRPGLAVTALSVLVVILLISLVVSLASGGPAATGTSTGACTGQFVESLPDSGATTSSEVVRELIQLPACRGLTPDQQSQVLSGLSAFAQKMEQVKA